MKQDVASQIVSPSQLTRVRSILVIRFRYLGDMVLLSPLFRNLRRHFPQAYLAVLADDTYMEVLRCQPDLSEVLAFPRDRIRRGPVRQRVREWSGFLCGLRAKSFDLVIDVANGTRSSIMARLTGARLRVGYRTSRPQWHTRFYNVRVEALDERGTHYRDHYLQPLTALGIPIVERGLLLQPDPHDREKAEQWISEQGLRQREFVAVHPGARLASKCWPAQRFGQLVDGLETSGVRTVLVGGHDELRLVNTILKETRVQPVNAVGLLSVGQLAALLEQSALFIGNDSGPMHVAAAVGTRVIALFGPSNPRLWSPVGDGHAVISKECPCRGKAVPDCPEGAERCLEAITVEEVETTARRLLKT